MKTQHFAVHQWEAVIHWYDIVRQWSTNCGPRHNCGPFSTFYWATQHLLLWAVWYV